MQYIHVYNTQNTYLKRYMCSNKNLIISDNALKVSEIPATCKPPCVCNGSTGQTTILVVRKHVTGVSKLDLGLVEMTCSCTVELITLSTITEIRIF